MRQQYYFLNHDFGSDPGHTELRIHVEKASLFVHKQIVTENMEIFAWG